ncbi:MAG: hypothetical protein QXU71_03670 [Candidatus Aenigmatarchaeota archaeon]
MIGIQPIIDIIALALQSVFIKSEENGVSLLLIGKPETAKTSSIFSFSNLNFVAYYDEITAKKLLDEFLPLVKNKEKRTLLIPDLINCIEKQRSTREQFLALIKSGIDDVGIKAISTYHKQLQFYKLIEGIKFNVITAITTDNFKKIKKYFRDTGLLSRFIPFSYDYSISLIKKVFDFLEGKKHISDVKFPKIKQKDIAIEDKPELFKEFETISTKMSIELSGYGFRLQKNLQRLAKANAILNNRTEVTKEDIEKVIYLSNWINFEFRSLG